jgi:hypothetical protein
MIKFTDAGPAKPKQAAPKPSAEAAVKAAAAESTDDARKATPKRKKNAPA